MTIFRRIIAASEFLCLCAALLCAVPQTARANCATPCTKSQITTDINTNWPDNTSGQITPALLRSTVLDLVNSYLDANGSSSFSCSSHQFLNAILTLSTYNCAQPAISDISGWGTGVATALGIAIGTAGAPVLFNGAGGTPSSLTLTNATGLPYAGLPTGSLDTVLGYFGSTTANAIAVNNCANALTYSTSTHTFGCNSTAGTGTVTTTGSPAANQTAVFSGATSITGVSVGTVGQQLTSNGAGSNPSYQSGGWTLLNTLTAASSSTLSDTSHITSSYNEYKLVFENVLPATNNVICEIQVHSNGSFPSTSYSANTIQATASSVSTVPTTTFIPCGAGNAALPNTGTGASGEITLYAATQTSSPKTWAGTFGQGNANVISVVSGTWTGGNTAIDGFQVLMSSGNIASGTVKLYGRL